VGRYRNAVALAILSSRRRSKRRSRLRSATVACAITTDVSTRSLSRSIPLEGQRGRERGAHGGDIAAAIRLR
jgi:mRNA-degrading endonuclease toxin of MazEF toxin-antitoxin module